jgi:hypothetical protein
MKEILIFVLGFSIPFGALLALSLAFACYRDAAKPRRF